MVRAVLLLITVSGIAACGCATQPARADGTPVVRHAGNIHHDRVARGCIYGRCGPPVGCPDGTCYSLYGAYGPYGGPLYWSRYTYGGWPYRGR